MDKWNTIHLLKATAEQLEDSAFIASCQQAYNAVKSKRSEAIEAALSVEGILDQVLLDLFVGRNTAKRDQMRELVLAAEFCSAFQKWKMLKQLMETVRDYFSPLNESQQKSLRKDIYELFNDRNKFAHGDIFVNAQDLTVWLRYYEAGTKFIAIDQPFLERLFGCALLAKDELLKLHNQFEPSIDTGALSIPAS